jgi:sugar phosphate isomerase/epimerase
MEFAVGIWNPDPSDQAIDALRAEDITAIEFGPPFLLQQDRETLIGAAERYRAAGIRLYACHAPFDDPAELSQLEDEARQNAIEIHIRSLERAALAGVECMVIHPGRRCAEDEIPERMDHLYASLERLVPAAQKAGVRLALENMLPAHVGCQSADVRRIVDHFDSPYLGVCLDTGHAHVNDEGVDAAFEILRDRIISFHLADNDGHKDQHSQPPYGTINWDAFVRAFQQMGFAYPATVEAPPWSRATSGTLLREVQALFAGAWPTFHLGDREARAICRRCGHYLFGPPDAPFCACDRTVPLPGG